MHLASASKRRRTPRQTFRTRSRGIRFFLSIPVTVPSTAAVAQVMVTSIAEPTSEVDPKGRAGVTFAT
jgi:hypothetical protein